MSDRHMRKSESLYFNGTYGTLPYHARIFRHEVDQDGMPVYSVYVIRFDNSGEYVSEIDRPLFASMLYPRRVVHAVIQSRTSD